jgi:spore germination protein YaaH
MVRNALSFFTLLFITLSCSSPGAVLEKGEDLSKESYHFNEVYGYLLQGQEESLTGNEPYNRIFYFSLTPDYTGRIKKNISRPAIILNNGIKPEVDLVITVLSDASLIHFVLDPQYGQRELFVTDILRVSNDFDGVQLDFEQIPKGESANFQAFVKVLKERLGSKRLTLAVPARTRFIKNDVYDYEYLSRYADRLIIMAYDEHWSTSEAGPVASAGWCEKVASYASSLIPRDKLVMGLPFYGRAWQRTKHSRAFSYDGARERLNNEKLLNKGYSREEGPFFTYTDKVTVDVYYDDRRSIGEKLRMYKGFGAGGVAFWRIGLGPDTIWGLINRE